MLEGLEKCREDDGGSYSWLSTVVRGCSGPFTASTGEQRGGCRRRISLVGSQIPGAGAPRPASRQRRVVTSSGGQRVPAKKFLSCPSVSIGSRWFRPVLIS